MATLLALSACGVTTPGVQCPGPIDDSFIRAQQTTREQVLRRFGEPFVVADGEAVFAYVACGYRRFVLVDEGPAFPLDPIVDLLLLRFDADGVVESHHKTEVSTNWETTVADWARTSRSEPTRKGP
jgi:hypothetical protein